MPEPSLVDSFFQTSRPNHRRCQEELYEHITDAFGVTTCVLEKCKGRNRADLFMVVEQVHIALEIQISDLSVKELNTRTKEYFRRGVAVLWLLPYVIGRSVQRFELRNWQAWLHTLYFGRIYCWEGGLNIRPVHFLPYFGWVPDRTWHDAHGNASSGGGYYKRYKRARYPMMGPALHLLDDFSWTHRKEWTFRDTRVPESLIYMDKSEPWWDSEDGHYERKPSTLRRRREVELSGPENEAEFLRMLAEDPTTWWSSFGTLDLTGVPRVVLFNGWYLYVYEREPGGYVFQCQMCQTRVRPGQLVVRHENFACVYHEPCFKVQRYIPAQRNSDATLNLRNPMEWEEAARHQRLLALLRRGTK